MTETARAYHTREAAVKATRRTAAAPTSKPAYRRSTRRTAVPRRCPGDCSSYGAGRACGLPGCDGW